MTDISLDGARTRYVADLLRVHPVFEEQLSEVVHLLGSLVGETRQSRSSALDPVRDDYLAHLRDGNRSLNEQLFDLAKACAHLFGPVLGLTPPTQ